MQLSKLFKKFVSDRKASVGSMGGKLIGLAVGCFLAVYTLPDAITTLSNETIWANTPAAVQALGGTVAPIVVIAVFIFLLLREGGLD